MVALEVLEVAESFFFGTARRLVLYPLSMVGLFVEGLAVHLSVLEEVFNCVCVEEALENILIPLGLYLRKLSKILRVSPVSQPLLEVVFVGHVLLGLGKLCHENICEA